MPFADITEDSIAVLIDRFYAKVRRNPEIGPLFNATVEDWDEHLIKLKSFWSAVMLTSGRYKGNPMAAHLKLPIEPSFFETWLGLWAETASEIFTPQIAQRFSVRAAQIGQSLKAALFFKPEMAFRRGAGSGA